MNKQVTKITVRLKKDEFAEPICINKEISPAIYREYLEPIREVSDPRLAFLGDNARIVSKIRLSRDQLAKLIAKEIAEAILQALESEDTFNGYSIND